MTTDPQQQQMIREAMKAIAERQTGPFQAGLRQDEAHYRRRDRRLADSAGTQHHRRGRRHVRCRHAVEPMAERPVGRHHARPRVAYPL